MTEQSMPLRSDPAEGGDTADTASEFAPGQQGDTGDSSREEAGLAESGAGASATGPVPNESAPGAGDALPDDVDSELSGEVNE